MIEFQTKLSKKEVIALNKFHLNKKMWIPSVVFSVLFLCLGVSMFLTAEDTSEQVAAIVFAVIFGVGFVPLCYLVIRIMVHFQLKTSKIISEDNLIHFTVTEDTLRIDNEKKDIQSITTMNWSLVYKAYQTKDYFFIYISNMQSYVLPICDLVSGSAEEFGELLRMKLGKQFKVK